MILILGCSEVFFERLGIKSSEVGECRNVQFGDKQQRDLRSELRVIISRFIERSISFTSPLSSLSSASQSCRHHTVSGTLLPVDAINMT